MAKREFDLITQARNAFGLLATMFAALLAWFGIGLFLGAELEMQIFLRRALLRIKEGFRVAPELRSRVKDPRYVL